VPSFSGSPT